MDINWPSARDFTWKLSSPWKSCHKTFSLYFPHASFFYPIRTESRGIREKIPQKSIRQTRRLSEKDGVQQNMPHSRAVTPIITLPNYSCTAILGKLERRSFFVDFSEGKKNSQFTKFLHTMLLIDWNRRLFCTQEKSEKRRIKKQEENFRLFSSPTIGGLSRLCSSMCS